MSESKHTPMPRILEKKPNDPTQPNIYHLNELKGLLAFIEPRLAAEGGIVGCRENDLCEACKAKAAIALAEKEE